MNPWIGSPNLLQILEATFGFLGALAAVVVILLAMRTAHVLTLTSHRRLLQIIVAIAALFMSAKLNAALGAFFIVARWWISPKNLRSLWPYLLGPLPYTL